MNTTASWSDLVESRARVLLHQRKLHRWAKADPAKVFDDLFNLLCDPATLMVAWERIRTNRGSRTAGLDGHTARDIERRGVELFLFRLREELRNGTFQPVPVRQRAIPIQGGKSRYLGIPTVRIGWCRRPSS